MPSETGIVLIGYDGSDGAAAAIRRAGAVLGPRPAIVAHVWDSLAALLLHTDVGGLTGPMRDAAAELDEEDRRDAERVATEGADLAREVGFDAEPHALQGKPKAWPTLLAKADEIDAAAIVIGSDGQGAVKSALLGSVSAGVLHHAHRPVLVVPPGDEDARTGTAVM
jgi:nucleotide-binding universal stress UspA family protein